MTLDEFVVLCQQLGAIPTSSRDLPRVGEHRAVVDKEGHSFLLAFTPARTASPTGEDEPAEFAVGVLSRDFPEYEGELFDPMEFDDSPQARKKDLTPVLMTSAQPIQFRKILHWPEGREPNPRSLEVRLGGAQFAKELAVWSKGHPYLTLRLLGSVEAVQALWRLIRLGWTEVRIGIPRLSALAVVHPSASQQLPDLSSTFEQLALMHDHMPPIKSIPHEAAKKLKKPIRWEDYIGGIFMLMMAPVAMFAVFSDQAWTVIDSTGSLGPAVALGSLLALPFLGLVGWWMVKKQKKAHSIALTLLFLLIDISVLVAAVGTVINGAADPGPAKKVLARVVRMKKIHHRKDTSRFVTLKTVPGDRTLELDLQEEIFEELAATPEAQRYVTITLHPGYLGWEWWDGIEKAAAP